MSVCWHELGGFNPPTHRQFQNWMTVDRSSNMPLTRWAALGGLCWLYAVVGLHDVCCFHDCALRGVHITHRTASDCSERYRTASSGIVRYRASRLPALPSGAVPCGVWTPPWSSRRRRPVEKLLFLYMYMRGNIYYVTARIRPGWSSLCGFGWYQCSNGECIPASRRCNGSPDCSDASDEFRCSYERLYQCEPNRYRCNSGECVADHDRCDGKPDCLDHSDESYCP